MSSKWFHLDVTGAHLWNYYSNSEGIGVFKNQKWFCSSLKLILIIQRLMCFMPLSRDGRRMAHCWLKAGHSKPVSYFQYSESRTVRNERASIFWTYWTGAPDRIAPTKFWSTGLCFRPSSLKHPSFSLLHYSLSIFDPVIIGFNFTICDIRFSFWTDITKKWRFRIAYCWAFLI